MSCVRIFVNELHSLEWLGILLARIAVGLLFFLSGRGKLFVPERREQMRRTLIEAHVPSNFFSELADEFRRPGKYASAAAFAGELPHKRCAQTWSHACDDCHALLFCIDH